MMGFLASSDALLREGVTQLPPRLRAVTLDYVQRHQVHGFAPPLGGAPDLYYSDFGARLLWVLDGPNNAIERLAEWTRQQSPRSVVEWFNYCNIQRLAGRESAAELLPQELPASGAYEHFLRMLLWEMAQRPYNPPLDEVLDLQRSGGGFAESAAGHFGQTSATAAALALLWGEPGLEEQVEQGCAFLVARQCGGFAALAGAAPDLLSTFTATLALAMLGREESVSLGDAAAFTRTCARSDGGFAANGQSASHSDLEYTWYGLATLGLLKRISLA
jgi:hypothetical protein